MMSENHLTNQCGHGSLHTHSQKYVDVLTFIVCYTNSNHAFCDRDSSERGLMIVVVLAMSR